MYKVKRIKSIISSHIFQVVHQTHKMSCSEDNNNIANNCKALMTAKCNSVTNVNYLI